MPIIATTAAVATSVKEVNKRSPGGLLGAVVIVVTLVLVLVGVVATAMVTAVFGGAAAEQDATGCGAPGLDALSSTVPGIPAVALAAYRNAAAASGVDWAILAAIGKHESGHGSANGSRLGPDGSATPMIKTPPLDGSGYGGNTTPLRYTGEGAIDGWDHAVGPMQFLLSTWYGGYGKDGNMDGVNDPNNIHDAALAAGLYLKARGIAIDEAAALFAYNRSQAYVSSIQYTAQQYRVAATEAAAATSPPVFPAATAILPAVAAPPKWSARNLGPVTPHVVMVANTIGERFAVDSIGGYRDTNDPQDHAAGLALDFMVDQPTGDALAEHLKQNADRYGVTYLIWRQRIWSVERASEGWRAMADRGSPTQNHMDHVHASFTGDPATIDVSGGCGFLPTAAGAGGSTGASQNNAWGGHLNGRIPTAQMCRVTYDTRHMLRCDAQRSFEALSRAFEAQFGNRIPITDSYRSYGAQVSIKARKGRFAAKPGTSNHGWGMAMDLGGGINRFSTPQYRWMFANAKRFGWFNPEWALQGHGKEEPWHWEFMGGAEAGTSPVTDIF